MVYNSLKILKVLEQQNRLFFLHKNGDQDIFVCYQQKNKNMHEWRETKQQKIEALFTYKAQLKDKGLLLPLFTSRRA